MKHITDMDDIPTNFYIRTSRKKYAEVNITPYQKLEIIKHQCLVFQLE